jgi:hypothetical protein
MAGAGIGYAGWRWGAAADAMAVTARELSGEIAATRGPLIGEIAGVRRDINALSEGVVDDLNVQAAALRKETLAEVVEIRKTADRRFGDTLARVDTALVKVDASLAKVEEIRGDLKPVLDHAASIAAQVDAAAPLFLDCEYNPDCAFNRFQGTSKAVEMAAQNFGQMSTDFRNALPGGMVTWQSIGVNVAGMTGNVQRLTTPRWYDRVIGYGLSAGAAYRDLNPGYNVGQGIRGLFTKHKEQ